MRHIIVICIWTIALWDCSYDRQPYNGISTEIIPSNIAGPDSLMRISFKDNELFKIALGGNTEYLSDTILSLKGKHFCIITLADYFQENQIFYVLFNIPDKILSQTEKLYLPDLELSLSDYKLLDSLTVTQDSLCLLSKTNSWAKTAIALDSIKCDKNHIINYYEFD